MNKKKAVIDHWLNKLKTGNVFQINDGLYCWGYVSLKEDLTVSSAAITAASAAV